MAMRTRGGDQLSEFYDALQKRIITIDDIATEEEAGIVKADGKSITVDEDGTLHGTGGEIASADKAGIVKPDNKTIEASEDGTLSAKVATGDSVGVVKPDGETITVDGDGTLHGAMKVDIATTEKAGIVKPDGDTITIEDDGTIKGAMKIGIATSETAGIVKPDDDTISVTEDGTIAVKNALKGTVGSETVPIYLNEGELTAVTKVGEASEADHAKTADKATTADSASQAAYLNFKLVGDGVDLNTYRGIEQAGIYLKTAENVTVTNTPAGVLPNEAGILEVMPLNAQGATEQRYTSFGEAHEYVRYSDDIGNWDGWTTIGPMSSVSEAAHADTADNAHYANVAKQLGSITVGSGTKPIYLNLGNPTEIDGTVGSEDIPVSLISGELTAVDKVKAAKTSDTATSLTNERKFKVTNGSVSSPEVSFNGTSDVNINLNNLDASTLTAGTVPIARLPQGALERLVTVADEAARFALTTGEVQLGDIVQQLDTKVMYVVVDESKLNESAGYTEFSAGLATKATEADHAKKADNATNATNATTADTATKLGSSTIGDATHGIYLQDGVPTKVEKVASAENADNATNATKAINADNATNATTAGTANKLGSTTIGSATRPIYLDNGTPKPVNIAGGSAKTVNTVPVVNGDGVMEVGKYLDFHVVDSTKDYDARLAVNNTNARTLTLPDESGTLAIVRRCLVGQSSLTTDNPWYKVATYETSSANIDTHISFYVYQTMTDDVNGILNIRLRTNNPVKFQSPSITWSNAVNIDPNDFVLAYTPSSTTPCKAELWAKMSNAWRAWVFTVIQESSRTAIGSVASKWKLINKFSAGDQAEITPGYTQKVSTISTIKNTADTATTISEVLPVEKGGTGKITAKEAAVSLLLNLDKSADQSIVEDKYFVYSNGNTASNLKKMSAIWDWLKPKVQSTPSTPINAANLNLDTLTYENYNGRIAYAGGGNTAQGKPEGVDSFGMLIFRSASGYTSQLMITTHTEVYFRNIGGGQAGEWKKIYPVTATKLGSTTIGSVTRPIYLDNGTPKPVNIAGGSAKTVNTVPVVNGDGVMEVGKYLDFHVVDSTKDYDARLAVNNTNARTLTLPDESGALAISRRCIVGQSSSTTDNPWYKVATYETSSANIDTHISFHVYKTMANDVNGILNIRLRTGNPAKFQTPSITWSSAVNIDPSDFVLAYTPSETTPCKAELWAKMSTAWNAWVFTVIQESSRTAVGSVASKWKLITKFSAGDQVEITPGYTQKTSTFSTLSNSVATATTATKLGTSSVGTTDRPIYLSSGVPTAMGGEIQVNYGGTGLSSTTNTSYTSTYFRAGTMATYSINSGNGCFCLVYS